MRPFAPVSEGRIAGVHLNPLRRCEPRGEHL